MTELPMDVFDFLIILSTSLDLAEANLADTQNSFIRLFLKKDEVQNLSLLIESSYQNQDGQTTNLNQDVIEKTTLILDYYLRQLPGLAYNRDKTEFLLLQSMDYRGPMNLEEEKNE